MHPLTAPQILRVWDEGRARSSAERALLLLAEAYPDESWDALASLPIGRRDDRLLALREQLFGSALTAVVGCPACSERLELSFSVADLRGGAEPPPADAELTVEAAGYDVEFRLPDSADLAALDGAGDGVAVRQRLLMRCLLGARRNGRARAVDRLPARVLDAVVRRMGELDTQADPQAALSCPACAHAWHAPFDIVSFLWAEIEAWVHRTLREVHVLASAYSWREADILALSPWRRQVYLELARR